MPSIFKLFGMLLFLYLVWRDMSEDYEDDDLAAYAWTALVGVLIGGRIGYGIVNWGEWGSLGEWLNFWQKSGFNYIGAFGGWLVATAGFVRYKNWKLWPFLEDGVGYFYLMISFMLVDEVVKTNFVVSALAYFGTAVLGWLGVNFIKKKYRSFLWYRSGRKGFGFFFSIFLVSILLVGTNLLMGAKGWIVAIYILGGLLSISGLFIIGEVFKKS